MSVFTSRVSVEISVPTDPDARVVIRKLAPKHIDAAAREQQLQSIRDMQAMGGPKFLQELSSLSSAEQQQIVNRDPVQGYDQAVLCQHGILSWSYDVKPSREAVDDLDEDTRYALAREILKLSRPKLFQSADDAEAARKNA